MISALHLLGSARRLAVGFGRYWRAGLLLLGLLLSGQWAVAQIPWGDLTRAAAMAGLLALLQVLFGLALSLHLLPRLTALLLSSAGVWIETSRGGYGPYHLFTLVILPTLVVLMLQYLLHRERPGTLFNPAGLGDQVRLGITAGALLLLWQSMAAFVPGLLAGQAQALGLRTPGDFLANGTVYALFVSRYREELLYRGFATAAVSSAVPGSWGLLVPVPSTAPTLPWG